MSDPAKLLDALRKDLAREFEIEGYVGRGDIALVYKAVEKQGRRTVALKVIPTDAPDGLGARVRKEARVAANLSHANILPIYASGEAAGTDYYTSKYIEGCSLDRVIKDQGALPMPLVLTVLRAIVAGLAYSHDRRINHRDVRGANVFIEPEGGIVLADPGIAKALDDKSSPKAMVGSPSFMSPEQAAGQRVGPQADQYSIGVLAFHMLTGKLPFEAADIKELLKLHQSAPPPPLTASRDDIPPALADVVTKALAKAPGDRYPTTRDMLRAVEAVPLSDKEQEAAVAQLGGFARLAPRPELITRGFEELEAEKKRAADARAAEEKRQAEQKAAEEKRKAEQQAADEKRLADIKAAEDKRQASLKAAEERRKAEQKAADEKRVAEQKAAEEKRQAELKTAEEKRIADEKKAAEERRFAAEKKAADERRAAEEKRLAEERRVLEEQRAEVERKETEVRRAAEARLAAEAKRLEDERRAVEEKNASEERRAAYEKRVADEKRAAEEKKAEERRRAEERRAADRRAADEEKAAEERRIAAEREADARRREERRAAEARAAEERAEELRRSEERRAAEARRAAEERRAEEARAAEARKAEEAAAQPEPRKKKKRPKAAPPPPPEPEPEPELEPPPAPPPPPPPPPPLPPIIVLPAEPRVPAEPVAPRVFRSVGPPPTPAQKPPAPPPPPPVAAEQGLMFVHGTPAPDTPPGEGPLTFVHGTPAPEIIPAAHVPPPPPPPPPTVLPPPIRAPEPSLARLSQEWTPPSEESVRASRGSGARPAPPPADLPEVPRQDAVPRPLPPRKRTLYIPVVPIVAVLLVGGAVAVGVPYVRGQLAEKARREAAAADSVRAAAVADSIAQATAAAALGFVRILGDLPEDAIIWLDEQRMGGRLFGAAPGEHTLEIETGEFEPWEAQVIMRSGDTLLVRVELVLPQGGDSVP